MGWLIIIFVVVGIITWFAVEIKKKLTIRPEIQMLIDLMAMDKDWVKAWHAWYHSSGVNVWTSNPNIGFSVKWGSKGIMDYDHKCRSGTNRVNLAEYKAIKSIIEGKAGIANSDVASVAARIAEMYGDKP